MKILTLIFIALCLSACSEKKHSSGEVKAYLKNVDCKGYPNKDFSTVDNQQLKKASIEKCESEIFRKKDAIKKSKKKEW